MGTTGCAIISDGCTDVARHQLINVLVSTPLGTIFIKATDTEGASKDGPYLAEFLDAETKKLGPKNVTAIITDSASVNAAAMAIITERYPHIA